MSRLRNVRRRHVPRWLLTRIYQGRWVTFLVSGDSDDSDDNGDGGSDSGHHLLTSGLGAQ